MAALEDFLQQANTALRDKTLEAEKVEEKLQKIETALTDKQQEISQLEEQLNGGTVAHRL